MKQSEAVRIPALLAARQPRPYVEEAMIEGIRMLVILGDEVDTVIQYIRGGGVKMPQLSTYGEIAEEAADADRLLARQRSSGRRNTTGEGVDWPRNWKLAEAKAAGRIWYAIPRAEPSVDEKPSFVLAQRAVSPERRTGPTLDSSLKRQRACQRLADAASGLAQLDFVKHKLEELKSDAQCLEKPDFIWLSLVESLSSMGNSRGYEGLFGDPENYERITFEALSSLPREGRLRVLAETLAAGAVRMPDRKAEWLAADFEQIEGMGGPAQAKAKLLSEPGRDTKIAFLKKFAGIGDKYARNIFMNVYHPEFRQCIAIDSRIESVLAELGLSELKSYEAREQFFLEVAETAGLDGWELDRMLYNFKNEVFARLRAS